MSLTATDLNHITSIVASIVKSATTDIPTKDNLHVFATKNDLHVFATKDDLKAFATKTDLDRFATKDDLKVFATKIDLERMESRLTTAITLLERDSFSRLDQHEARITRLESAH